MNGVLVIDKPEGFTSHDVVAKLRGILGTKKVGHTGTLDPFATGVLVVLVGKATRLARYLDRDRKTYEAVLRFGFETETGDRTGDPKGPVEEASISPDELLEVLDSFVGEIEQVPPMYSAKKVKGRKLYELARKGVEVEREARKVTVHELELNGEGQDKREFVVTVACSAGMYIRVLAEDVGKKIGIGCHLAELRRTKAGRFSLSDSYTLDALETLKNEGKLTSAVVPMAEAVGHLPSIDLSEDDARRISNGMSIESTSYFDAPLRLIYQGRLFAIGNTCADEGLIKPKLVFESETL